MKPALVIMILLAALLQMALQSHPQGQGTSSIKFRAVEIWVDSKDQPLAAYQLEFKPSKGEVKIVGIEGGAHAAFSQPPYYDPAAMRQERVIIAAFSTAPARELPRGKIRVATVHIQVTGEEIPEFVVKSMAAATVDGKAIPVELSWNTGSET